jgi:arylsulfatase A-like enzyme
MFTFSGKDKTMLFRAILSRTVATALAVTALAIQLVFAAEAPGTKPNIVIILADDLGFGDTGCYGASKIPTQNVDRLAREGLRFQDAHSTSATCTPARYALLTGEYPWRKKGTGVLPGDAELIIQPGRTTVASLLQRAGYRTGVVGKWHLGLGDKGGPDWNGEIKPGPREIGFDYSFLMPATGDRVPCVYVENQRVVGLDPNDPIQVSYGEPVGSEPTGKDHPELLKLHPSHGHDQTIINGISRIGYMSGGKAARWVDEDMADTFTRMAVAFIEQNKDRPFFLYFATHDPHVPRAPNPRFVGKSGCGVRGDVIVQFDWCAGEILNVLDRFNLSTNTLVILSSDNGPVVDDGYRDGAVENLDGHRPAGPLRGGKYSIFEGGTRVPLITRWPQHIKPGVSDALVCHVDFLASFAALTGQKLASGEGPDSRNVLPALLGQSQTGRDLLVEHASVLALRDGSWKYIDPGTGPSRNPATNTELGNDPAGQLYDLAGDLGETNNLLRAQSDRSQKLLEELKAAREVSGKKAVGQD